MGAIAVTFAVGLSSSLNMVADGLSHAKTEPVQVTLVGSGGGGQQLSPSAQQAAVEAALRDIERGAARRISGGRGADRP